MKPDFIQLFLLLMALWPASVAVTVLLWRYLKA